MDGGLRAAARISRALGRLGGGLCLALAVLPGPAGAQRIEISDAVAADLRAVLPCVDAGFIKSPSSALAFCGAPVPSVEFILLPPGRIARQTVARLRSHCGAPDQACDLLALEDGWLAAETRDGPVHATALVSVGDHLLEIRSMAPDTPSAVETARVVLALVLPLVNGAVGAED